MNTTYSILPKTLRGERYYVVAYDTSCSRLRKKLAQVCFEAGLFRVQLSHFAGCIRDLHAQSLKDRLTQLAWTGAKRNDPKPEQPRARIFIYRLDQGQAWFALHSESHQTSLTDPQDALRPKRYDDYIIFGPD